MIFLQSSGQGGMMNLIFFGGIILVFYFFIIRPQQKKQKNQNNFVNQMAKGDEVVTSSGIVGKISKIEDNFVSLQIDQKTFIKVLKSAISKDMTDAIKPKADSK
jgi:preprotein translocase subunit YajC